ncbi:hypothetical protein HXX76_009474 [Chlamydomonas incerta]|uniref:Uncharacterized protein n=1 Tax=Chlamydomonas incerta TaxID=51695 RepID=A0A835VZJ6_CHLIN|nr:hypothetical protein HXX76_009474 [Chlamydomonas incerta]|eukprot:KAG2431459.1 hypothetical protein HXX76_009474 [Chlamydomonas incerta]
MPAAVSEDGPYPPEQQQYPPADYNGGSGGRSSGAGPSRLNQVAMANGGKQHQHQQYFEDGGGEQLYDGGEARQFEYGQYGDDQDGHAEAAAAAAAAGYGAAVGAIEDDGYDGRGEASYDGGDNGGDGAGTAAANSASGGWPSDPEDMLSLLQQQGGQYRSWVAQCAATALAALDPDYDPSGPVAAPVPAPGAGDAHGAEGGARVPGDVPGMVVAMDVAGQARHYLLMLKAAAESAREAGRALSAFEALSLPPPELSEGAADPAAVASGEAAEAEYVSAAYAVTTAISNAAAQVEALREHCGSAEELLRQLGASDRCSGDADADAGAYAGAPAATTGPASLEAPLSRRLAGVGSALAGRLRREAAELLTALRWPPPLAESDAAGPEAIAAAVAGAGDGEGTFAGFEAHPVLARRLVGVLTALTHFQMAVEQRPAFLRLLAGPQRRGRGSAGSGYEDEEGEQEDPGAEGEEGEEEDLAKPLLWAAQVLAEPVSRRLRSHFHPGAPSGTGRLDRPAWLFATGLSWLRRHGHCLAALDDMLACLQLKPHYNMPAEFTRAVQEELLALLRDVRLPALLAATAEAERQAAEAADEQAADGGGGQEDAAAAIAAAEAAAGVGGLWTGLMDAAAAWDIALLPLLGAGGPAAEAAAARAGALLDGYARAGDGARGAARACDVLDPLAAGGTSDMHARFVAVAAVAASSAAVPSTTAAADGDAANAAAAGQQRAFGPALAGWAAAEGGAALRAVEVAAYDDSCLLAPAEEATARALGLSDDLGDEGNGASASASAAAAVAVAGGGVAPPGPWQRDTWPPVLAAEAAAVLDGLIARSRWLAAAPAAQAAWLEAAAGPVLGLLKRRLGRLVEVAVAGGDALGEAGLPKVCAALCAARHLDDHLHSLLLTDLAPLVAALARLDATAAAAAAAGAGGSSIPGSPASRGTGSVAAAAAGKLGGGGFWGGLLAAAGGGGAASPARRALQDGVTALAGGAGLGGTSLVSAALGGAGAGAGGPLPPVLGEYVAAFGRLHRDGCLKLAREVALGFGRHSVAYRHAIEANPQFPFLPDEDLDEAMNGGRLGGDEDGHGRVRPAPSITPSFAPALLFLQTTLHRLSRTCDKVTFADVWRGAALSINRFVFNFIATESRFTRAGARQFAADVAGLAQLFAPYTRRGGAAGAAAGGQHFRELQAAARLLCLGDEEAADVMRRASTAAVAARAAASTTTPSKSIQSRASPAKAHARGDPVRAGMSADPVLSAAGMAVLSPLQIMNVIEHRI